MKQETSKMKSKATSPKIKYTKTITKELVAEVDIYGKTPEKLFSRAKQLEKEQGAKSILHDRFNWNKTEAAYQWNLQQARILIDTIKVSWRRDDGTKVETSAYVNVTFQKEDSNREYMRKTEAVKNPDLRTQVIERALATAEHWKNENYIYREMAGDILNPIFEVIDSTSEKWQKQKQKKS